MRITVKLFATLSRYLPPGTERNVAEIDVPAGSTVADVIARLGLPEEEVHMTLLDGRFVAPEERQKTTLAPGQALAIWPPVAGG
jgi:sulfur carrier protein ThiS